MQQIHSGSMRVFDLAVRLFHWLQVVLIAALWFSAEQEWYGLHQTLAFVLASFLGARIIWGFVGSDTAKFSQFVPSLARLKQYLREKQPAVGHNPLSALMILALLLLVLLQFFSGLMTTDEVMTEGPLYSVVPDWLSGLAGSWHELGFNLLLGLVALHVGAALLHQWRGDRVVSAMWHGRKNLPVTGSITGSITVPEPNLRRVTGYLLLVAVFLAGFAWWQGSAVWPQLLADLQAIQAL